MQPSTKPFSQSCENNKRVIFDRIKEHFKPGQRVLEIGSRTAQHVTFFAAELPLIRWLPSDIPDNMDTLRQCLDGYQQHNILPPISFDVTQDPWPVSTANPSDLSTGVDGVFTANTLHIMPFAAVECFFRGVGRVLRPRGTLCVYGPFKYNGQFTTSSNELFDTSLKSQYAESGIRDFERVNELAEAQQLELLHDYDMPANNQLLVWSMRR